MTDCWVCTNIEEVKWNGDSEVSHCNKCHALWRRVSKTAHCVKCHRTFSTNNATEPHREYYRDENNNYTFRCKDPATVTNSRGPAYGWPRPNSYGTPVWHGFNADFTHGESVKQASAEDSTIPVPQAT